jgi:uncharacterized protein (TIGR00730 family)
MELTFRPKNGAADTLIQQLIDLVEGIQRPEIVREMIIASLKAGQEDDEGVDLKLMNTSLKEMRFTAKAFGPYRHIKKVTVFGSARTRPDETPFKMAYDLGSMLAESGYMVITGGGPGIMQAAHEGAGPDYAFGVNIRLPFEQKANPIIEKDSKNINYKYFFNRKIAFLKESDAIVLFPGGFGTQDEAMETLTLVQTGKRNPVPIILMDDPEDKYWTEWIYFVKGKLLSRGYISESDLALFEIVESPRAAVQIINRFYSRYHSLRYIGDRLVIRLSSAMSEKAVQELIGEFSDILRPDGKIVLSGPLPEESNEPETRNLSRLIVDFKRENFGRLRELIDAINSG